MAHDGADLRPGQLVTAISVRDGEVHVLRGHVVRADADVVTLQLDDAAVADTTLRTGARLTLNYLVEAHGWRVRARVDAVRPGGAVDVGLLERPTRGENRDFIRAELTLPTFVERLGTTDLPEAQGLQLRHRTAPPDPGWTERTIDLSAGGVRFLWDRLARKGDLLDVRFVLPGGEEPVEVIGRVVRVRARDAGQEIALRFEGVDERVQDALFEAVSSIYHAEIHRRLGATAPEGDTSP